ncbi:MAG: GrpB family protein [Acidocella sp.]|uniref:GrpB family protein n=1 Tax=Acidocella sp. TaxID=50710 RepID=UPI003FD6F7C2
MNDTIHIHDYSTEWPHQFAAEARRIATALEALAPRIEHIGSTSVPGLAAKPVIDIMVGLDDFRHTAEVVAALERLGYAQWYEDPDRSERLFFVRWADAAREHRLSHIHAVPAGSVFWRDHLAFRSRLRADADLASAYAALKRGLAVAHQTDRDAYTAAKTPFIRAVLEAP